MGRSPCCEKVGLKKGPWTPEEDQKLLAYIDEHGHGSWRALPTKAGLQRCGKSCRLRWTNYLRPDIKRGKFSLQEEQTIIQLHALLGNRWSAIATHLPKRTDNEIKNYWNTHLKKRLAKMGIDPVTHKPKADAVGSSAADGGNSRSAANLSHMAQWESARLEAEARLARESKLRAQASAFLIHPPPSSPPLPPPPAPTQPTPPAPPCLDVLRAWQGVWSKPAAATAADMESPTSTSSFSETLPSMIALLDGNSNICHGSEFDGEEVEWKCFGKPSRASDAAFSMDEESMFGDNGPWLAEGGVGIDDTLPSGGDFTGMLLEGSDEHNNSSEGCGESDNVDGGGSCVEEGEEENKNYWNSILNLVNSSSPSNSPPLF